MFHNLKHRPLIKINDAKTEKLCNIISKNGHRKWVLDDWLAYPNLSVTGQICCLS